VTSLSASIPQPPSLTDVGHRNLSPKSMSYQPATEVRLQNNLAGDPGPLLGRWVSQPFDQGQIYDGFAAQPEWPPQAPNQLPEAPPRESDLDSMPHDDPPDQSFVPRVRPISTALPPDLSVPTIVPVGPSTGHATTTGQPHRIANLENGASLGTNLREPIQLGPPAPRSARSLPRPIGGIGALPPEQQSGCRVGPPGLGIRYYDRFLSGGYGETDVSARTQRRIQAARGLPQQ